MDSTPRTFEFVEGNSRKFWHVTRMPLGYHVHYGRLGTNGQQQEKTFADESKAQKEYEKIIAEKLKKGYTETTARVSKPQTLTEALEVTLDDHPDDLATWMALADYLAEQNDPRGEWMQVQIALEEETRSAEERANLQKREKELLKKHRTEWLGLLATKKPKQMKLQWRRGHLHTLSVEYLEWDYVRSLVASPVARFLHTLQAESLSSYDPEYGEELPEGMNLNRATTALSLALESPWLAHLRHLSLGESVDPEEDTYSSNHTTGGGLPDILRRMPRLESFAFFGRGLDMDHLFRIPMPSLRSLILYHLRDNHPLGVLAANKEWSSLELLRIFPSHQWNTSVLPQLEVIRFLQSPHFPNLRELHLHASDLGNEGCRAIVESGWLKQLRVLSLRHGCIQDDGARLLLASTDLPRLQRLDLSGNEIGDAVAQQIQSLGPTFTASHQGEPGDNAYLYAGDME